METIMQIAKEAQREFGMLWWFIGVNFGTMLVIAVDWVICIGAEISSMSIANDELVVAQCAMCVHMWRDYIAKQLRRTIVCAVLVSSVGYVLGYKEITDIVLVTAIFLQSSYSTGLFTLYTVKAHIMSRLKLLKQST